MARYSVVAELVEDGYSFTLTKAATFGMARKAVAFADWAPGLHPSVSLLQLLLANEAAARRGQFVWVAHETVACMSGIELDMLGLPPRCPYSLHLSSDGAVSDPRFRIGLTWTNGNAGEVSGLRRTGTQLANAVERFTVGEPVYSLLVETEELNGLGSSLLDHKALDARMVQFDRVKMVLAQATGDAGADRYLENLTIHHATGLSIEARQDSADIFEPVLFGDIPNPAASPENEDAVTERRALLPGEQALKLRSVLFPRQGARSHYRLAEGVYAVLDPPVEAALRVIQRVNASDASTRAAFRANPRSFLIQEVEEAGGSGDIICDSPVVREPMEYGERVLGIRQWNGVNISFAIPVYHSWFPVDGEDVEFHTIDVPGAQQLLFVRPVEVEKLRTAIEAAKSQGRETVEFKGKPYPLTQDFETVVAGLSGKVSHLENRPKTKALEDGKSGKLLVLRVAENEEDLLFNARLRDPAGTLVRTQADARLRTVPMPHQVEGIGWLRNAFLSGMPGVLLADDMGLGKTYMVLAFLHWLRSNETGVRRPVLVVAPKKLLDVWRDQIAEHLGEEGLGRPVLAYDDNLKHLKVSAGKDGELGRQTLDVAALRSADWVLTTYETLRDYHFSFAAVRFRIGVYDEAQKMKSMASLVNNAAKCQQPDFTILMTGTPIENSVMDLWTLMDIAWPGLLGMSGKEFSKTYGDGPSPEVLSELKSKLVESAQVGDRICPPVMLRRFKSSTLAGLPKKTEVPWREEMSAEQVRVYDAVVADQKAHRVSALTALQALRAAAFHPDLRIPSGPEDHRQLIDCSARFRVLFKVLDQASKAGERVLVFLDLHKGQRVLSELIRARYRLKEHPKVINGDTATKALNAIKSEFQEGRGFAVLLLGPRSAGFGLTLTAANHVVHLNRWWNPAVEDQCSDRVYRLGQDKDVFIHIPIAVHPALKEASFDEVLDEMLARKRALISEIVVPTAMGNEDWDEMYKRLIGGQSQADILAQVDTMGWQAFEDWTAEQFSRAGFQRHATPRGGDGGADVVLRPPPERPGRGIICQCKHRALGEGAVDETAVEEVIRARNTYMARYAWLGDPMLAAVTNGRFTVAAVKLAKARDVKLVARADLEQINQTISRLCSGGA
jgi:superfamily II DNA or RNA helicase